MPLKLHQLTLPPTPATLSLFTSLVACECLSYDQPLNTFFRLFRHDGSPAGFEELRERQLKEWEADGTARWWVVVDEEGEGEGGNGGVKGKVVGAAKWNVFEKDPYAGGKVVGEDGERRPWGEAWWWEEGEPREFASTLYDCFQRDRWEKMARPHVLLAMLFVHPDYRRRGIGRMLIEWGVQEADHLNLESYIEATDQGKPCYEACGFTYMGTNYWEAAKRNPSAKWMEMEQYLQTPIHTYRMWRPVGGGFVEGEGGTRAPWEE